MNHRPTELQSTNGKCGQRAQSYACVLQTQAPYSQWGLLSRKSGYDSSLTKQHICAPKIYTVVLTMTSKPYLVFLKCKNYFLTGKNNNSHCN